MTKHIVTVLVVVMAGLTVLVGVPAVLFVVELYTDHPMEPATTGVKQP